MGYEVSFAELGSYGWLFMQPFFRIGAFLMVMPMIGTQLVPMRIRMGLAAVLTLLVIPWVPGVEAAPVLSVGLFVQVAGQVLLGVAMAFVVQLLFQVFVLAGQMMAMQMGLGFASMSDPANGVYVAILSQFYLLLTTLVFMAMNGHLVALEVLIESFRVVPVGAPWPVDSVGALAGLGGWVFSSALLVALPAVTAILIVNLAFGVMTRAAPQLNVFTLGFPFTMLMGLVIIWVSLSGFLGQYERIAAQALAYLRDLI